MTGILDAFTGSSQALSNFKPTYERVLQLFWPPPISRTRPSSRPVFKLVVWWSLYTMPADICRPPAGKRSLTRVSGTSSFDIFRSNNTRPCSPPHATRVFNDGTVKGSNPLLEAAREMHEGVSSCKPCRSNPQNQVDNHVQLQLLGQSVSRWVLADEQVSVQRRRSWW